MDISQLYWVKPGQDHGPDHYVNEIFMNTNTIPTQCYFVNDKTALFVRYPQGTNLDKWHSTKNLKALANMGLTLKLSSIQLDKNSVFINSAPESIFNLSQEALLEHINETNPNIQAIGAYVPPRRGHLQKLGSVKLTVVTRNMANSILTYGIRIAGCLIEPGSIRQAHYLKQQQCNFCFRFHPGKCQAELPVCPNCAKNHSRHQCKDRENLMCTNCRFPHKATSNHCRVRSSMLTNDLINDIDINNIMCPFGKVLQKAPNLAPSTSNGEEINNSEWPTINSNSPNIPTQPTSAWGMPSATTSLASKFINPLAPISPLTSYYDVLNIALMFDDWYAAFTTLMGIFGLPVVEFPPPLRAKFKGKETCRVPTVQESTFPAKLLNPNNKGPNHSADTTQPSNPNQILLQHIEAQQNAYQSAQKIPLHDSLPLTGANTVPLPMRPSKERKDSKGHNKSSKGNGLLPTPSEPILPSSLSLAPTLNTLAKPTNKDNNTNNAIQSKELQWGDDPSYPAYKSTPDLSIATDSPLDMPLLEDTQIMYSDKPSQESKNRLSMDSEQFRSTIKNFENLSGTKPKVPKKSTQTKQQTTTNTSPVKQPQTKFNMGSNKKISPKPKAIARPKYKHSTPSPQQEGMCTSSETESDSDEEVNVDEPDEIEANTTEQEDILEDLTKSSSEIAIPNRRQLRSNSKTSTNL